MLTRCGCTAVVCRTTLQQGCTKPWSPQNCSAALGLGIGMGLGDEVGVGDAQPAVLSQRRKRNEERVCL